MSLVAEEKSCVAQRSVCTRTASDIYPTVLVNDGCCLYLWPILELIMMSQHEIA